jgi:outer membrane protein OmpA-like peptidoglycan-associated protein
MAATAMAIGCVALISDTAAAVTSPAGQPVQAANEDDWVAPYWDMYGLISEGSMWNPEAFSRLGQPQPGVESAQIEMRVVEVVEPREEEDIAVFIDPTLQAACNLQQPEVTFAFDSAQLQDDADQTLQRLARCLDEYPLADAYLSITGHADPRGTEEYNRELGLDRADAVADALERLGIAENRVDTYSVGEAMASDDPDAWSGDRRVVIALDR